MVWLIVMALTLTLGLYLGGNMGAGEPPTPSAPVFASEPGDLGEITDYNEAVNLGFVTASGYPTPTYELTGTASEGVSILVNGSPVSLPATVPSAHVTSISIIVTDYIDGAFSLTLTAENTQGENTAAASGDVVTVIAPTFASEPGTMSEITDYDVPVSIPFVQASGSPAPAYILDGTLPEGALILIGGSSVLLPAEIEALDFGLIEIVVRSTVTGTAYLTMTASNGVSPDAEADAEIPLDVIAPPIWTPGSLSINLPPSAPLLFGDGLAASDTTTIKVVSLPDKGIYYIDDGDDTPLEVDDEFPYADLADLTGEADGDTGAVTGALVLQAIGDGTANITITVSIVEGLVTARELEVEIDSVTSLGIDTSEIVGNATMENDSDLNIYHEDLS